MIKLIKENYKYFIFCLIFIIINTLFINYMFMSNDKLDVGLLYFLVLIVSILIQVILSFVLLKNQKEKIEKVFLILTIPIGILYLLAIPIGLVPDEATHYARIYEIASFHLTSDINKDGIGGRVMRAEVFEDLAEETTFTYNELFKNIKNVDKTKKFITFSSASLYSFVCYIPQAVGVFIGKTFNFPIAITAYLGRIFNFITWLLLMYFSIKIIPFYKKFLLFVALLPIVMQEAISLSPDSLTIGVAALLFSYVMHIVYNHKGKLKKQDYIILSVLSIVMSFCKIVYIPLCLLLFLIPKEKFKSTKDKYIKIFGLAFIVVLLNAIWLLIASKYLVEFQEGVNSKEQIMFILHNPIKYIQIFFNTWAVDVSFYLYTMVGKGLEWFNIDLPFIYPFMTLAVLVILVYKQKYNKIVVKNSQKWLLLFIITTILLLIFTSLYVQWTAVGAPIIKGVQGRYFIPIIFLVPFLLMPNKKSVDLKEKDNSYLASYLMFQSIFVLVTIFLNHI